MRILMLPPIVFLLLAVAMVGLHYTAPVFELLPPSLRWAGFGLAVVGLGIANWHARLFRRLGTNINTFREPGSLTREGLFAQTRNPMYAGMLIALVGIACTLGSLSPFMAPPIFFALANYWYIPQEEAAMARKFGETYAAYTRQVPRWF